MNITVENWNDLLGIDIGVVLFKGPLSSRREWISLELRFPDHKDFEVWNDVGMDFVKETFDFINNMISKPWLIIIIIGGNNINIKLHWEDGWRGEVGEEDGEVCAQLGDSW